MNNLATGLIFAIRTQIGALRDAASTFGLVEIDLWHFRNAMDRIAEAIDRTEIRLSDRSPPIGMIDVEHLRKVHTDLRQAESDIREYATSGLSGMVNDDAFCAWASSLLRQGPPPDPEINIYRAGGPPN